MQLSDILYRYFGTRELVVTTEAGRDAGIEKMLVDLGLARDRGQRFGLWAVLHQLGAAPDLDVAFPDEADRAAARRFMELTAAVEAGETG